MPHNNALNLTSRAWQAGRGSQVNAGVGRRGGAPMSVGRPVVAIIVMAIVALRNAGAEEAPAPDECHWQAIPEIKAHLAVPDGWLFEKLVGNDVLIYEVRPSGPQFKGVRARYRLEVRRGVAKSEVVARARGFVQSVRTAAVEALHLKSNRSAL
jgi:hypothetical protein